MTLIERALDATLKAEDARKVDYIVDQLLYGKRDDADVLSLTETLRRIVK